MLFGIANFGVVDCSKKSRTICKQYRTKGFAFYPIKSFGKLKEKVLLNWEKII